MKTMFFSFRWDVFYTLLMTLVLAAPQNTFCQTATHLNETATLKINEDITLGFTHYQLTITPKGLDCALQHLSQHSQNQKPSPLPAGDLVIDGTNCNSLNQNTSNGHKLNNPLLAQALLLNIQIQLNPEIANTKLNSLNCSANPSLLQALPPNATFEDLQTVTNYALGNLTFQPFLDLLTHGLYCYNKQLRQNSDWKDLLPAFYSVREAVATADALVDNLNLYPSFAEESIYVDSNHGYGQEAVINIHDLQGKLVLAMNISELTTSPIRLNMYNFSDGMYEVLLFTKGQPIQSGTLVIQ